jgi:hypothetical protein
MEGFAGREDVHLVCKDLEMDIEAGYPLDVDAGRGALVRAEQAIDRLLGIVEVVDDLIAMAVGWADRVMRMLKVQNRQSPWGTEKLFLANATPHHSPAFANSGTQRYKGVGCVPFQPLGGPVPLVPL